MDQFFSGISTRCRRDRAQVVAWFREHRDSVRWSVWAYTVSASMVALMIALVRRSLPAPHCDVFLIGAITYLSTIAVWTWTWAGLALRADRLEPATARAIPDVAVFFGPVFTGTTTTMMAPVTLLAFVRSGEATAVARRPGPSCFCGAGSRDNHDLWFDRLYAAGRRNEHAAWRRANVDRPIHTGAGWRHRGPKLG